MRRLARGTAARGTAGGDPPLVGGESGVAGLAGLLAACADGDLRGRLGLDAGSRVLVIGSEGATDPEVYARLVGRTPEEVAQERSISS
jgi:diaminopropionate ammonia-lyase